MTKIIVLDPGHGGIESGAIGLNGIKEKDLNLILAKQVKTWLLSLNKFKVQMTRDKDESLSLFYRTYLQKKIKADIFVSIHCNSFPSSHAFGFESFNYPGSSQGKKLNNFICEAVRKQQPTLYFRGAKEANFNVLRETSCPAVLVECGFLSNSEDLKLLTSFTFQNDLTLAIATGINNFFVT